MEKNITAAAMALRAGVYGVVTIEDVIECGDEASISPLNAVKYEILANDKGFQISRDFSDGFQDTYVKFNSFLYPDDVKDSEKDLIQMLTDRFDEYDREIIELGSLFVVHWQAGSDDEAIDEAVRQFTKKLETSKL